MSELWVGLISGTSADGVDAALVRIAGAALAPDVLAFCSLPFEPELTERVHGLLAGTADLRELGRLDVELGARFADAALEVMRKGSVASTDVRGIGSHGQTVGHFPEADVRNTLQLGAAAVIHARTGVPVISDFRRADMAVRGQGAPLTPLFHHAAFAVAGERRCVLNVGGFTNLTYLPGDDLHGVVAFDPGPGNALIDRGAHWASDGAERFDTGGQRARRGRVWPDVLAALLEDPYLRLPPPKSTGHEHFDADFFERARTGVVEAGGSPDDVVATLTAFTVESVAQAAKRFLPGAPERWILCGGGSANAALVDGLRERLAPAIVETSEVHGIPVDGLEAIAFAVLGWRSSRGEPGNLPQATGASEPAVLGSATPPNAFGNR